MDDIQTLIETITRAGDNLVAFASQSPEACAQALALLGHNPARVQTWAEQIATLRVIGTSPYAAEFVNDDLAWVRDEYPDSQFNVIRQALVESACDRGATPGYVAEDAWAALLRLAMIARLHPEDENEDEGTANA